MELLQTIKELCAIPGISGDEGAVRDYISARLEGKCELRTDPLGNLLATVKGGKKPANKLLFSAHMDEVGFIITHIEDSGLLRFSTVGGIDGRLVAGRGVEVGAARVYGVIGAKAWHHAGEKERETPLSPDALYIDIGAQTRGAAEQLVQPGDRAVFHAPLQRLGDDKLLCRALDDRAGCALLLHLAQEELPYDCHFAFTVQEETGCSGGKTAGYAVDPDLAVIVETTTASDIAGVTPDKTVCRLGGGPVLSFMDRGAIYNRELYRLGMELAEELGIPAQPKEGVYGGNESRAVQTAAGGAKVLAVSMPCRYLHSPSCVLQESDIEHTLRLLRELIGRLGAL